MSAPKTEQQSQIDKWRQDCQHIEDLVNNCPALTDVDLLHDWYQEIHGWLVFIGNAAAQAESEYLQKCAWDLEGSAIPGEVWERIKRSSTMVGNYLAGVNPELFGIWQRLRNLNRNLETILSDMRTQLVNLRETDRRDNMSAQNQKSTYSNNPAAAGGDLGWPKKAR